MRNLFLAFFITFMSFFSGNAKSTSNYNTITGEGSVVFNAKLKQFYVDKDDNAILKQDDEKHSIKYKFTFDENIRSFSSESQLREFIVNNQSETNGMYEVFIDNKLEYRVKIVNGLKVDGGEFSGGSGIVDICSFEGLRRCAANRIRDQNWYDMVACVLAGFNCFVTHYMSCFADNCT